jgi:hypothetical protein
MRVTDVADNQLATAALAYAASRWPVFPVAPGSNAPPLITSWPGLATTNRAIICGWWEWRPRANIGLHCRDLFVLDIDPRHNGLASLDILIAKHGRLPPTPTQRTPSGGWHLLFRGTAPGIGNSAGHPALGPGLDVRTTGGYIVLPPSARPDGRYRWCRERTPDDLPLAPTPDWLLELAATPRHPPSSPTIVALDPETSDRLAGYAFGKEIIAVKDAREGTRNKTLYVAARKLGRFCAEGTLAWTEVESELLNAAAAAGLEAGKAAATVNSALRSRGFVHG